MDKQNQTGISKVELEDKLKMYEQYIAQLQQQVVSYQRFDMLMGLLNTKSFTEDPMYCNAKNKVIDQVLIGLGIIEVENEKVE